MPYIKDLIRRDELDSGSIALNSGELNYQISRRVLRGETMAHSMLEDVQHFINQYIGTQPSYAKYNDIIGVVNCSCQELYRRGLIGVDEIFIYNQIEHQMYCVLDLYENQKIKENGDIL